ncbi:MAG: DUF1501 domain-containing protein [Planctomycetaceae bacterium]|jgi:hypothetical protein|nr:DUF1501 domain-containing protein [Planctomycetaceae bacterium]
MKTQRRDLLKTSVGMLSCSLPMWLSVQRQATASAAVRFRPGSGKAKNCIVVYCWGGMSHHETFDPKMTASAEVRGLFGTIQTDIAGYHMSEHIPLMAQQTDKLAIIRSIHHSDSAHGRGMYWNMTGHKPPRVGNIPPLREDWPSLAATVSAFRDAPRGVPKAVRLPYPMVDNGTLQAGEYGGFLGINYDPVVIRTPAGKAWGGVSRTLGSEVLDLGEEKDLPQLQRRSQLLSRLEDPLQRESAFQSFDHFRELATDMLINGKVRSAYNLDNEPSKVRESYGDHIGGQSLLLARRLIEAGVPITQVTCSAGDLNGGKGDMWDTHSDNFNRLKNNLLPVWDQGCSALLNDLQDRGMLDETLVVFLTEFGRTPKINGSAGRDHYPNVYSVALAGGGIRGGRIYGSSDTNGAYPRNNPCTPADLHATIFNALGIHHNSEIHDLLGRPLAICEGEPLPLL